MIREIKHYMGKPLEDMTQGELIEALKDIGNRYQETLNERVNISRRIPKPSKSPIIFVCLACLFIGWIAGQGTEYVRTYEELNTCRQQNAEIAGIEHQLDKLPVRAMRSK